MKFFFDRCMAPQWAALSIDDMIWRFFKVWPDIVQHATKVKEPTVFPVRCGSALKVEEYCKTSKIGR